MRAADINSLGLVATYEVEAVLEAGGALSVDTTAVVSNPMPWRVSVIAFNLSTLRTGRAEVTAAVVDGEPVEVQLDDQTVLVPLAVPLETGGRTTIGLSYNARLNLSPRSGTDEWGFARSGGVVTLYRWIPWLTRSTPFDRPSVGDPFVTASSPMVEVSITTDRPMVFATSGVPTREGTTDYTFQAHDVRDFNVTASADYRTTTRSVAGTAITFFHRTLDPQPVLDVAAQAFARFSERIGPYPHGTLNIAEIGPWAPLESPGLFWLPSNAPARLVPWMTAHETAHQWFYAVVGNDQAREPFADEAVSDFIARDLISRFVRSQCPPGLLDSSIYELGECYPWVVYIQGDDYLREYRQRIGAGAFWQALAAYYRRHEHGIGGTREVLAALDEAADGESSYQRLFPRLHVPAMPCLVGRFR